MSDLVDQVKVLSNKASKVAKATKQKELVEQLEAGQLVLWNEQERGVPNELVRCAIFSAKNHRSPRELYSTRAPLTVAVIGGGKVIFFGEELRQDDETVWMQLIHLAKESRSDTVKFTPNSFLKSISWDSSQKSYKRLLDTIRRLASCNIELYSNRFKKGISAKLIAHYEYNDNTDEKRNNEPWVVQVFSKDDKNDLLFLFDKLYSRLEWRQRLALPSGLATWLHSFYSTHRDPYPHKVQTLAEGAGLLLKSEADEALPAAERLLKERQRLHEAKRYLKNAHQALIEQGFLQSFVITKTNLVQVVRA
jgi:hypothetical protein